MIPLWKIESFDFSLDIMRQMLDDMRTVFIFIDRAVLIVELLLLRRRLASEDRERRQVATSRLETSRFSGSLARNVLEHLLLAVLIDVTIFA